MAFRPKKNGHAISDEELVRAYHQGDNTSFVELISRYLDLIDAKLTQFHCSGAEREDVKQEALMALLNAVKLYDPDKETRFSTFASRCVENSVLRSLQHRNTKKARLLSDAVSIDEAKEIAVQENPEDLYIDQEGYHVMLGKIEVNLSEFEKNVLFSYLDGNSYAQISTQFGASQKSVDNALQRVRRKLKTVFSK
ncbi:Stage 0 sporulation protein H [uncultured Ruminococcus sp.]|uniref:sigma-70 family RNA polymerase sigma factor n=1 Tax=Massiliimalia timonensis TaxID=1987501 RepID=UPI0008234BD9|nr:sigma-70 family RNA polymerase sigma factor [Massiliimalia timonensis]MBS7176415.1 sigma-70 family RNA polymerase sigma factor [Clostridiales bacterium]SCH60811.1 Stage 0 sporulation protein H [uncultured Clostridium sp.]SCH74730.1 Stage 0 sporulation protein H [uncultured Ruminococcus sp.]